MAKVEILPVTVCRFSKGKCVEVIDTERLVWKKNGKEYTKWILQQYEVITVNEVRMIKVEETPPQNYKVLERILLT